MGESCFWSFDGAILRINLYPRLGGTLGYWFGCKWNTVAGLPDVSLEVFFPHAGSQ